MSARPRRPRRRRRLRRTALLFGGALFANELWFAVATLIENLGGAKVLRSVGAGFDRVLLDTAGALAWMLLFALLLSLAVGAAWACVSLVAWKQVLRRVRSHTRATGHRRAVRWAFWSCSALVFFNAWYSLHQVLLPGSRLALSPLAMTVGALPMQLPVRWGSAVMPLACGLAALLLVAEALWRSRALRRGAVLGAGSLLLLSAGYTRLTDPGPIRPFTADGNIVLLGLDSLQLNRLPAGGAAQDIAPRISAFLEGSLRFDNAWTPIARTYPSWLTLLTGRDPAHHGGRFNLIPDDRLAADNPYLPRMLAEQGFTTFHGTDEVRFCILRSCFGYQHLLHPRMGVQDFFLATVYDFSAANLARQVPLGDDLLPAIRDNRASVSYNPALFARNLVRALDALPRDRRAFLSMHLCGDHFPFTLPAPYAHAGPDPVANCIRMVDAQAGTILDWLQASGLMERSTVVMLSDHGDGWSGRDGDRRNSHGDDFSSLWANRIVLGFRAPSLPPGVRNDFVRMSDLYPTLLDLAGVPHPQAPIDGLSLVPLMRGEPGPPRTLYAETDLDRKIYSVKQLIDQQALWYAVDRATGLVHLTPRAVEEFSFYKSYMLIRGDRRLEITPHQKSFRLTAFDQATGLDAPAPPPMNAAERARLLRELSEHCGLDAGALCEQAQQRGFLPELLSAR